VRAETPWMSMAIEDSLVLPSSNFIHRGAAHGLKN
jgi:hypothetical protein